MRNMKEPAFGQRSFCNVFALCQTPPSWQTADDEDDGGSVDIMDMPTASEIAAAPSEERLEASGLERASRRRHYPVPAQALHLTKRSASLQSGEQLSVSSCQSDRTNPLCHETTNATLASGTDTGAENERRRAETTTTTGAVTEAATVPETCASRQDSLPAATDDPPSTHESDGDGVTREATRTRDRTAAATPAGHGATNKEPLHDSDAPMVVSRETTHHVPLGVLSHESSGVLSPSELPFQRGDTNGDETPPDTTDEDFVVMRLTDVVKETLFFHREELLLRAWLSAENCLRAGARAQERMEGYRNPDVTDAFVTRIQTVVKRFSESSEYDSIMTNMRIFMDTIAMFNLEQRFDLNELWAACDPSFVWSFRRSRQASRCGESVENGDPFLVTGARSPVALSSETNTDTPRPSITNRRGPSSLFLRLGSTSKKLRKPSKDERAPNKRPGHLFHLRRHRGSKELSPATKKELPTSPIPWSHDVQKGLELSHRINVNGALSVRLRTKLPIPLFQILAILYETDLYYKWVPYCKTCTRLGVLSRASMILQQICEYPWPIRQKENISYCFGIDALDEFGSVLILSTALPDDVPSFLGCPIPPPMKKISRIPSSTFLFVLSPVNVGDATIIELFANVDMGVTTLRSVLLPILKLVVLRSVKGFFHKIGVLATHFEVSGYAKKVRESPEVYEWIRRRIAEGIRRGQFRKGSSVATLLLDELKGSN